MPDDNSKLVYSTEQTIPRRGNVSQRNIRNEKPAAKAPGTNLCPGRQRLIVRLDRKARGGKSVTVIEGLRISQKEREAFLKQLKTGLGTGGTLRDTALEIQGDHREELMITLKRMGYSPKCSGG
jgi:translation initiation factor 1